jgi:PAS domain S-box-containing protein
LSTLFNTSPLGISLTTMEGQFLAVNPNATTDRLHRRGACRLNVTKLYREPGERTTIVNRLQARQPVHDFRVVLQTKDGSPFTANISAGRLTGSDSDIFVAVVEDETEILEAEAALHQQEKRWAEEKAVEDERNRLARELHDAVTQSLFTAAMIAETLPGVWERQPEAALDNLKNLHQLTRGALAEMRALLLELHPSSLADRPLGI